MAVPLAAPIEDPTMTAIDTQRDPERHPQPAPDALRERVRATWTAGDFDRIAVSYAAGAADFVARLGLGAGERVLDVACGTGNLAIPAARAGARVTGIDIAPIAIAHLADRSAAGGLGIDTHVGDAEQMPFEDASYDAAITMFGAMFAGHPDRAASELLRVVRPGGRIAMANWTPDSLVADMLKATVAYAPPPAGVPSPLFWGSPDVVRERLGAGASSITFERRTIALEFPVTPAETVDLFRTWYGPTVRTFAALDPVKQAALFEDLERLFTAHNRAPGAGTRLESEYLAVVAVRA